MAKRLSEKQLRFIELWNGNATQTAEMAGYSGPQYAGVRCMKNVNICQAIQEQRAAEIKPQVMSRIERQIFWTETIKGNESDADFKDRLKASELLGRSEADFMERVGVETQNKPIPDMPDEMTAKEAEEMYRDILGG